MLYQRSTSNKTFNDEDLKKNNNC